jgi:hypothetical protein
MVVTFSCGVSTAPPKACRYSFNGRLVGTFWEQDPSKQIKICKFQTQRENLQLSDLVYNYLISLPFEIRHFTIEVRMPQGVEVQVLSPAPY